MVKRHRVLIVDDNHEIARGARLRLHAAGYDTIEAHGGCEGVSAAIEHHPDAILMDVRMPNMDGLQALAELQGGKATKGIPIVMLSASIVDQQAAFEKGARFFVKKPYQGTSLIAAVDRAVAETKTLNAEGVIQS